MGLVIRRATARELEDVSRHWVSSYAPGNRIVTVGSTMRTLAQRLWKRAHRLLVGELLEESDCHVLVLEEVPSEPLGWVVFRPAMPDREGEVHYVYVLDKARRCGLGKRLIDHAAEFGAINPSHATASGRSLVHEKETQAEATPEVGVLSG